MKRMPIVILTTTLISMFAIYLLANNLNFIAYLIIVILPILFNTIYIINEKNSGKIYTFINSLADAAIYTLVYSIGSYFVFINGGYTKIAENSFDVNSHNIKIGLVEGLTVADLFLPFFVALIVFYLAGRKNQRNE